jgi:protein-disulfide isomerase
VDDKSKNQDQMAGDVATNAPETFTVSRATFNYVVVGALFLVIGLVIGGLAFGRSGGGIEGAELRALIEDAVSTAVDEAVINSIADTVADSVSVAVAEATGGLAGGVSVPDGEPAVSRAELMEMMESAVAQGRSDDLDRLADDDPSIGPEDAPVTMVEFSDFNCQFCTRYATQTLQQIIDHYGDQLRVVYRDYPVIGGEVSRVAALAANCANEQGAFWEFHRLLFSNTSARDRDSYLTFAGELGLDVEAFTFCLDSERYASEVNLDFIDGQSLGVRGTPGFYINGTYVSGALPFEYFADVIDRELRRVGEEPPARDADGEAEASS